MDFLEAAYKEALKALAKDEVPVGAVLVCDGKIIARAHNLKENRSVCLAHAEILAIQKASRKLGDWRLTGCELYVTLEPCLMCLSALQQARVKRVFYGACDPKAGALSLGYNFHKDVRTNHRFEVIEMLNEKCGKILTDFFRRKRKSIS